MSSVAVELAGLALQAARNLSDYGSDEILALATLGQCQEAAGSFDAALSSYLEGAERMQPNGRTYAWLDYAWLVARTKLKDRYPTARKLLALFVPDRSILFAADLFRIAGSEAMMLADEGQIDAARQRAIGALATIKVTHSGFARHPSVGLVENVDASVLSRLQHIAAGQADNADGQ